MKTLALIAFGVIAGSGAAAAGAVNDAYDLQERCGKRAAEIFHKQFPTENGRSAAWSTTTTKFFANYRDHYNTKLNHCFMLQTTIGITGGMPATTIVLFDLNENRDYGSYSRVVTSPTPMDCYVNSRKCTSETEWNDWTRSYMED